MSKAKLQAAKELIQEGDRDTARSLLLTISEDETAQKWLSKLGHPSVKKSRTWLLLSGMIGLLLVVGVGSFFIGREAMRTEIADAFKVTFSGLTVPTAIPTVNPDAPGGKNNPLPVGQALNGNRQSIVLLSLEKPSKFSFYEFGTEIRPAEGAQFVGIKIEFQCPKTEVTCSSSSGDLSLLLNDGRLVPQNQEYYSPDNTLQDQNIVGGASIQVWRFYEVPQSAAIQAVVLSDGYGGQQVYGLPPD